MNDERTVTREVWLEARKALLAREKAFSRERDALSAARRALPRVKVEKPYVFEGVDGPVSLRALFGDKRQLIVQHFMFHPDWQQGCKSCSYMADNLSGGLVHLVQRDIAFVMISRAPIAKLTAFKERMGWKARWVSSNGSDFNTDFGVSFTPEQVARKERLYNYETIAHKAEEAPGISAFVREGDDVFHTYSTYARGVEMAMGTYQWIDLTPRGREEEGLSFTMSWLRLHDQYP